MESAEPYNPRWTPEKRTAWRNQRWKTAMNLRAQGKTYAEIAQQVGVSTSYIPMLLFQAKRNFYERLDTPKYPEPKLLTYEMCMLYQLKDFLAEVADGEC